MVSHESTKPKKGFEFVAKCETFFFFSEGNLNDDDRENSNDEDQENSNDDNDNLH
jgi:hypothetical protein